MFIQGSPAPAFEDTGEINFACAKCGNVLVQGYRLRTLIAVDIECFACKAVSRTDAWPTNEPLPAKLVSMGDSGRYLLASTVDLSNRDVALSCSQEIARVQAAMGIRDPGGGRFELSSDGLQAIELRLRILCNDFERWVVRTRNAAAKGNQFFLESPPAWALLQLQGSLNNGTIDLRGPDGVAFTFIQVLLHLADRWSHHEKFPQISAALTNEFPHTITQFIAASYLADHGNPIGFTEIQPNQGRSTDMFVNTGPHTRIGIEVKAPAELQWPSAPPSQERLLRTVEKQLRSARGQIDPVRGGLVVLGSSIPARGFPGLLENIITDLIERGRVSTRIAGIGAVCLSPHPTLFSNTVDQAKTEVSAAVFMKVNPRFDGPPLVRVEP